MKNQSEEIINKNNYIQVKHIDEETHITTIYKYKNKCKNYIYYTHNGHNKYYGRGKIDINGKKFIIINNCYSSVPHNNITYEEFIILMQIRNIIHYYLMKE